MKKVNIYTLMIAVALFSCKDKPAETVEKTNVVVDTVKIPVLPPSVPLHIKQFTASDQTSSKLLTLRALFERRILTKRPPKTKYFFDITYYDSVGKFYYIEQNPVLRPGADSTDAVPPALPYFYKYYPENRKIVDAATNEEIK